jgi:tetratricopeptide (TPR) repeat protein
MLLNNRYLLFVILVGLFVAGCNSTSKQNPYRLAVARRLYDQGQYRQAQEVLSHFILENRSDAAMLCEAYYLRGLCRRYQNVSGDSDVEKDFAKAIGRSCHPMIKGLAHVGLGHIHFEQGLVSLNKAKYHYLTALNTLEEAAPKDAVLYRLGVTLQRLGLWSQADRYLQQCVDGFSSSEFAEQARRRIGAKTFRLQVGAFSDLNRARKKIASMQKSGMRFDSTVETTNRKQLYFVRSGRYSTYQMAFSQLKGLSAKEPDAIIVASP